jgi:hypothetical protein
LTNEETLKNIVEVAGNPIKFLDYVWISDPLRGAVRFEHWNHLIETLRAFEKDNLVIILKARQIGISWLLAAYALWVILTKPAANVLLISKGEREATELLAKCRFIYSHLPDWLRPELSFDSATMLGIKVMESKCVALPSTEAAGRSEAATLVICDEWDYHQAAEANFGALKPTIDAGGKLLGVSTVNKQQPDSFFKKIIREVITNHFRLLFYGWNVRPNRDNDWYEKQKSEYPDYLLEQEYPGSLEEALSPLSAKSVFDRDALNKLFSEVVKPDIKRGYIYILKPPKVGVHYVAGADVGEGVGMDYSALTVIGNYGFCDEVCAVIHSNTIKTDMFAWEIDNLCKQYFNPFLGVENNSLGVAVLNVLSDLRYTNLYSSGKEKKKPGFTTTEKIRQTSLIELSNSIADGSFITRFKPQILEMMDFHFKEDGKAEAGRGAHDDLVISAMIALQMRKYRPPINKITPIQVGGTPTIKTFVRT